MKKIILKTLKIIYWLFVSISVIVTALGLTAMLALATEEGGAPGIDPEANFIFWMIITLISSVILAILATLESIANFFRRLYFLWR